MTSGDTSSALSHFEQSATIFTQLVAENRDGEVSSCNLATSHSEIADCHVMAGSVEEARQHYKKALTIWSDWLLKNPDDSIAAEYLAFTLATCDVDSLRDGKRAVEIAKRVCDATGYKKTEHLECLAAAYAEVNDFESAIRLVMKAIELAGDDSRASQRYARQLANYKEKKPLRASMFWKTPEASDAPTANKVSPGDG